MVRVPARTIEPGTPQPPAMWFRQHLPERQGAQRLGRYTAAMQRLLRSAAPSRARSILIQHQGHNGHGGTAVRSDFTVVSIWGSGADDVWFWCAGGTVLHWNGTTCAPFDLPVGEDDELYCIARSAP